MEDVNPYASPAGELSSPVQAPPEDPDKPPRYAWRDGNLLVVGHNALLPDQCILCNAPASTQLERTYYWHHPLLYLTILLNIILYLILVLILRRSMVVPFGLCRDCSAKRRRNLSIGMFVMLAPVVLLLLASMAGEVNLMLAVPPTILVTIAGATLLNRAEHVLSPKRIDHRFGRFGKAGAAFLAALPAWQEP